MSDFMGFNISSSFGVLPDALQIHEKRAEILANNLANQDTPGYKAQDLDFRAVLQGIKQQDYDTTVSSALDNIQYRTVTQPSIDGNTVDGQIEQSEFSENALRYLASLRFLNGKISGLLRAIKGD